MKDERLLRSIGFIDEKYIKEAESKMKKSSVMKRIAAFAACFGIIIALGLYLFLPFKQESRISNYEGTEYYPLIEKLDGYLYKPEKQYKNNFEYLLAKLDNTTKRDDIVAETPNSSARPAPGDDMKFEDATPPTSNAPGSAPEGNGSYSEVTDNQVEGVIEADIFKRTDKYIFRLQGSKLSIFSIDGENSEMVSSTQIPFMNDEFSYEESKLEMYLSEDGNTVTLIKQYTNTDKKSAVGIISLDVSDVTNVKERAKVSIDGSYKSSRMAGGKLLLISEFYFNVKNVDYSKPETYVPSIDRGDGKECIRFEDIIMPENIGHTRYSVVALLGENDLELLGASALLNFTDDIYVSENNVYVTREYTKSAQISDKLFRDADTVDISILGYGEGSLIKKGIITLEGKIKDQYSLDEYEGHLRIVTSTSERIYKDDGGSAPNVSESANLYVYELIGNTKIAEVKGFAPEGECAESVRFDGDSAYVCTAEVIKFTDPVFFFDLSDYSNITYTDTGVISGYSTSLINLNDGFLLGIGPQNFMYNKVSVYEEINGEVETVSEYLFMGTYSTEYKSYLVNRDENMFGFAVNYYYSTETAESYECAYILLVFNGYELQEILLTEFGTNRDHVSRVRAVYIDGYLYLTNDSLFKVVNIDA